MPTDTPPPTTYDHKPAHDFADAMNARLDELQTTSHAAIRWALVEAYMAGRAEALKQWEMSRP